VIFATASHGESIMRHSALFATLSLLALGAVFAANAQQPAGLPRAKAPAGAEVFFVAPANGATVGQDVKVEFGVKGIAIAPAANVRPARVTITPAGRPEGTTARRCADSERRDAQTLWQGTDRRHDPPRARRSRCNSISPTHCTCSSSPPIVSKKITIHVK
jgi:hypothetical protein